MNRIKLFTKKRGVIRIYSRIPRRKSFDATIKVVVRVHMQINLYPWF